MNKKSLFCLFTMMMFAVSCMAASKKFTLVIDPGHGGKDHGAIGVYSREKDLTLKFGLAFGKLVEQRCPDVKVIYTRKTDVFIPLVTRAEIANKNHADLFISVHINALAGGRKVRGVQTYTLGQGQNTGRKGIIKNLEVAKRENSVILLEENYQQTYQGFDPTSPESNIMFEFIQDVNMQKSVELAKYMQQHICAATGLKDMGAHQNNLAVLRLSSMPGCLLELGFISTPEEELFMNAPQVADMYARGIFNAFAQYKNRYYEGLTVPYKAPKKVTPTVPEIVPQVYKQKEETKTKKAKRKSEPTPVLSKKEEKKVEETTTTDSRPVTETSKPEVIAESRDDIPAPVNPDVPIFKVQILSSSRKIALNDEALKGLKGCEWYQEGTLWKYTFGSSTNYNEIRKLQKELTNRFPDAFIIAFKNGQRTNVNEAIQTFLQLKKK
ncbi:N-acetylmuramoyl-L-alanine amidase [Prevotella sp. TCVGH]|uniref:N-acetylmuramoyl-L-alanine amidase family protein n=1 Tax=Prevotella sp. TCVGH TaxID=2182433 RepID=UPI00201E6438|nr:N-acetylmuramoyl-L-alanine amidase [Prevotella sp. TCVGH]MCL6749212.1 N-acetylmuramoyl-L-alanine amidase [Prevotella sp. TCVGH]